LKIAILYPRLAQLGGVERIIISLAKNFNSVIFTGYYEPSKAYEVFKELNIIEYGHALGNTKLHNYEGILKSVLLDLEDFDFIMPHVFPNTSVSLKCGERTIWYCHSPLPTIYDLKPYFLSFYGTLGKSFFLATHFFLEIFDRMFVKNIAKIVCNSNITRERIKRIYGREAEVVYPGIDIKRFERKDFENKLLCIGRFSSADINKRPLLAIKAMKFLPDKTLYITGNDSYQYKLMKEAPSNVKFLGRVCDKTLRELYARCLAVIFPSFNEDFGMIPIEAMASGKPVVACYDGGGVCETIVDEKTGFLTDPKPESIARAIRRLDDENLLREMSENCLQRAKMFSEENFIKEMKRVFKEFNN